MRLGNSALSLISNASNDEPAATVTEVGTLNPSPSPREPTKLVACRDEALFARAPIGRCFVHPAFVLWRASSRLSGFAFWGTPTSDDAAVLIRLLHARHALGFVDDATITDTRGLVALVPETFAAMQTYVTTRSARASEQLGTLFVLLDSTPASALVYGVNASFGGIPNMRAAASYLDIFENVGVVDATTLAATLEEITHDARSERPLIAALREHIRTCLARASVATAARALGVSARSLQRALASTGTTFVRELQKARATEASSLLVRSEWKVERIASHVGFSSASHFRAIFQHEYGVAPSEYRARRSERPA